MKHQDDVYLGCLGCVGVLKEWLHRGLQSVLEADRDALSWSTLDTCRLSDRALLVIAQEIRANRECDKSARSQVARALGIDSGADLGGAKPRKAARPKPGRRKPARVSVGLPDSATA